ncbi:MAG TPA: hypothetical protein VIY27_09105 [Myxococcota bacterium]
MSYSDELRAAIRRVIRGQREDVTAAQARAIKALYGYVKSTAIPAALRYHDADPGDYGWSSLSEDAWYAVEGTAKYQKLQRALDATGVAEMAGPATFDVAAEDYLKQR